MGSKASPDQTPEGQNTDKISAYDESFAVSEDGRPIPIVRGQRKTAGRYVMGPFYGQRIWEEPPKKQGK